jgi:hypothetical protein
MACCPVTGVFGLTVIKKVSAVTLVAGQQNLKRLSLVAHAAFELWVGFSIEHFFLQGRIPYSAAALSRKTFFFISGDKCAESLSIISLENGQVLSGCG